MTTVTEIVLDHFQKWRQLQRSYLSVLQKWRQSQRSSPNRSFRARLPSKTNLQSQFLTTVTRGKPGASPRQARGKPAAGWTRRFAELTFDVGAVHFSLQNTAFREPAIYPNHTSSCKNDNSYRDRTSPLPKVTTVTEIVLDHFQKWRQLQRSYLTTSKKRRQLQRLYLTTSQSDDSYRDRTSAYSKSDDSHRDHRQIEAFVRDFLQKRISKVNFWRQSHGASPGQARGKPAAGWTRRFAELTFDVGAAHFSLQNTAFREPAIYPNHTSSCKNDNGYRDRTSPLPKVTTVTEIVLDHFQKWRQLQRSYLTTSKSDDSYRDRTWPLPKVTTVTEIVPQRTPKVTTVTEIIAKSKLSCETSFKNESPKSIFDDSHTGQARGKPGASPRQARGRLNPPFRGAYFRRRSSAFFLAKHSISRAGLSTQIILQVAKMTTVTEIVLHHFQKWRQLQRSYLTTSKSDDSYKDRTSPLPKVTTVTEIVLQRIPKVTTVTKIVPHHFQKWRQLQKSYLTTSKSDDSYRDRNWPLPKATTVTEIVLDHFPKWRQLQRSYFSVLQKWRQLQRSYLTTSKSDGSYRNRTWPLPKATTVTEIVIDPFQKRRQLQRSYLTTSKSDDSYRDRTSAYSKSDDSHRDHRQIEAFVRDFLQKRISKVNFWRQSHGASPGQARGRLNPPFRGAYFRRRSSALFLAKRSISRAGYLPKSYFKLQKWQQLQRSYFTTSKSDDSYRDRTWPLPKVTTVTEIVLDHFQKWRQLQRSYLTTSKSDDSYRNRNWPLPKVTTVTEIVLDHFQQWRQLERSYLTTSKSDDSYKDPSQNEAFVR